CGEKRGGYLVNAARGPGMTAAEPPGSQPAAPSRTMATQGFDGVFGTARPVAAARREHRTHGEPIELDEADQQPTGQLPHDFPAVTVVARRPAPERGCDAGRDAPRRWGREGAARNAANSSSASLRRLRLIMAKFGPA